MRCSGCSANDRTPSLGCSRPPPYPDGSAAAKLRTALLEVRADCASPGETRVRLLLTRAGVPEPELNVVVVAGRPPGDQVWRRERVVLEYEGDDHRVDKRKFRSDIDDYEAFQAAGWTVVRVTGDDLHGDRPRKLVARMRKLLRR